MNLQHGYILHNDIDDDDFRIHYLFTVQYGRIFLPISVFSSFYSHFSVWSLSYTNLYLMGLIIYSLLKHSLSVSFCESNLALITMRQMCADA